MAQEKNMIFFSFSWRQNTVSSINANVSWLILLTLVFTSRHLWTHWAGNTLGNCTQSSTQARRWQTFSELHQKKKKKRTFSGGICRRRRRRRRVDSMSLVPLSLPLCHTPNPQRYQNCDVNHDLSITCCSWEFVLRILRMRTGGRKPENGLVDLFPSKGNMKKLILLPKHRIQNDSSNQKSFLIRPPYS